MVSTILFDFDGTISTLRHGWEAIMQPFMLEELGDRSTAMAQEVESYIGLSTGVQTIEQMEWLRGRVSKTGAAPKDAFEYKAIYVERILELVRSRQAMVERGEKTRGDFLVKGSEEFLTRLCEKGIRLLVASGTDHPDICNEIEYLGLSGYFHDVKGAPVNAFGCSKDKVLRELVESEGLSGSSVCVIGDGRVEIALGRELGAWTIGVASDEENGGLSEAKQRRLVAAGAHKIIPDFSMADEILRWIEDR